ncbi:MAG: family 20 glycosylhydrolase [Planctomycetales bacterium]|nr:family 20 glycosylhydrolase [Planctomycetales bacterium]
MSKRPINPDQTILAIWFLACTLPCFSGQDISIIPRPVSLETRSDSFVLDKKVAVVCADPADEAVAAYFVASLTEQTGLSLPQKHRKPFWGRCILLTSRGADSALGDEGYELNVAGRTITITAPKPAGLFYGVQTLLQLIQEQSGGYTIPGVFVRDYPRFAWRGMHLDESRHFFGAAFVKKYIDLLAMHKMNVFHWHIVDDQGWRLEIKKYPKLTELGAWRTGEDGVHWDYRGMRFPGKDSGEKLYGGCYTQEQVKEIIAYAKERFVTIVPEIEIPGHSWAALLAYPELTCTQTRPDAEGHHRQDAYCAGKEQTFQFLQDILDETLDLFPSEFIHVGGDEVNKAYWSQCADCKRRMEEEDLKDINELQSYIIKRMEKYLNAKGRRLIGWDEILEAGLAPNAAVMSWRGMGGGIAAAQAGHDVVMTPVDPLYFDAPQDDPRYEPTTIGYSPNTLEDVYLFEPVPPMLGAENARHVLGAQANVWTEWMFTSNRVEYMAYPRACALAEAVWTPADLKNWNDFKNRMGKHYLRLDQRGLQYRRPALKGFGERTLFVDEYTIAIEKPIREMVVRYTLDGTEPTENSTLYEAPFTVSHRCVVKAAGWSPNGLRTPVLSGTFEPATLYDAVAESGLQPGLKCRYYTGQFRTVGDIEKGTLQKTAMLADFRFPESIQKENFGLIYDGYVRIPEDGLYTFYTASDDGSRLLIQGQAVVDNDGPHSMSEKSGQIGLKAGLHPLEVRFFEGDGAESLIVSCEGPGLEKKRIPAELLFSKASTEHSGQPMINYLQEETKEQFDRRIDWWRLARFGMFIHWGLYAVPGGEWDGQTGHGEWILTTAQIPIQRYEQFAGQFNPVLFDAAQWVRMAREAGMKYIVITSKHHDGFCLFDSKVARYDVMDAAPFKRDILKELADECKKQGVRLCFYYSIMDWNHPDYLPRRDWEDRPAEGADFDRYVAYMKAQLKELIERYDPGVLWFDGEWEHTWNHERGVDLYNYVRTLKPDIIVNNRVDTGRGGMEGIHDARKYAGDFGTPEQQIPATGIQGYDWETCMTMNQHWGWNKNDKMFKSGTDLIQKLVDIASKGGNFLLNVGPKEDGMFPQESIDRLREIGRWMSTNGESIYGTSASIFSELDWGRSTTRGNTLYLHVFDWPAEGRLWVPGLITEAGQAVLLSAPDQPLEVEHVNDGVYLRLPQKAVDPAVSVIRLTFDQTPRVISPPRIMGRQQFYPSSLVAIEGGAGDVQICYTLDGTEPTAQSALYRQPFTLETSTPLQCRIFRNGRPVSPVIKREFEKLSPHAAQEVINAQPGLRYLTYVGQWDKLPEFTGLNPQGSGLTKAVDLTVQPQPEYFAIRYAGYFRADQDGLYEFWLDSDDGSRLRVAGQVVVDNDGLHSPLQKSGVIALKQGLHPVEIDYFQAAGGTMLDLYYAGPGMNKQKIAAAVFYNP